VSLGALLRSLWRIGVALWIGAMIVALTVFSTLAVFTWRGSDPHIGPYVALGEAYLLPPMVPFLAWSLFRGTRRLARLIRAT
jgi:hypothetical protein